jgi:signal transduction histidine kinase
MGTSARRSRSLIWQIGLVALPVVILSGIALHFLREDKSSMEQEAHDRARALVRSLARRVGERAGAHFGRRPVKVPLLEGVVVGGQIRSPKSYPYPLAPPDWPERLSAGELRLWRAAQDAIYIRQDRNAARSCLASLLATGLPREVRANAEYLLLTLATDSDRERLVDRATSLARRSRGIPAESGVPLSHVALLFALQQTSPVILGRELEDELTHLVHEHPSFLVSAVLEAAKRVASSTSSLAAVTVLADEWHNHEKALSLMRDFLKRSPSPANPWEAALEASGELFLALATPRESGWHVILIPAAVAQQTFRKALDADPLLEIPGYAAAGIEIGGTFWPVFGAAGRDAPLLASATETMEVAGARHPLTLRMELAQPELLYSPYRRRLWFVVALILSSAAAALVGITGLWQGMRRQARLSELKSNFVSSVSHELRAPLGAIRLMAEGLDAGRISDPAKQKEYAHLIVHECRRLSSLVENMLDFSRIDQGRRRYRFGPVDLLALARQTLALMEPYAAERDVRIVLREPGAELAGSTASWDVRAVEQALVNLVDNAIKHSPAGAPVNVSLESMTAGAAVRFWVEDYGEGIPKEAHARIFDLFYRLGSELRRETQGAGIGLSIVKHVAEAHGGRVLVESAPGCGSRFALELPLVPPDARLEHTP